MILKIKGTEFLVDFDQSNDKVTKINSIKVLTTQNVRFELSEESQLKNIIEGRLNKYLEEHKLLYRELLLKENL